jgi:long-chain acyl-CoA synthetase
MMAGSSVAYARSIPQLAEDLTIVRPTVMIAVPRIFERVHARIRDKLEARVPPSRAGSSPTALAVGWRRFEQARGGEAGRPISCSPRCSIGWSGARCARASADGCASP